MHSYMLDQIIQVLLSMMACDALVSLWQTRSKLGVNCLNSGCGGDTVGLT